MDDVQRHARIVRVGCQATVVFLTGMIGAGVNEPPWRRKSVGGQQDQVLLALNVPQVLDAGVDLEQIAS